MREPGFAPEPVDSQSMNFQSGTVPGGSTNDWTLYTMLLITLLSHFWEDKRTGLSGFMTNEVTQTFYATRNTYSTQKYIYFCFNNDS